MSLPTAVPPVQTPFPRTRSQARTGLAGFLAQDTTVFLSFLTADALCWLLAYTAMVDLRYFSHLFSDASSAVGFQLSVCLVQLIVLAACLFIVGGYDRRTNFLSLGYMSEHVISLVAAGVVGGLLVYAGSAYTQTLRPSRGVFLSSLAAFAPLSLLIRRQVGTVMQAGRARTYFLVLGAGERTRHFYRSYLASSNHERLHFVDPQSKSTQVGQSIDPADSASPQVEAQTPERLIQLAANSSGIIIAEPDRLSPDLLDSLTRLHYEDVPVYTLETFYERHWRRVPTYAIDPTWPLQMGTQLINASPYSHAKRLFDLFAAGAGLLILSPAFLLLALLVFLESGRPVFFRQRRIGRDRHGFSLCKFRSMYVRPPGQEGSLYTGERDARITKVGWWLRKLRLDELPQLWNVFKGDMSLIGPRAEWDQLVDRYEKEISCYHFRHLVKPGITGWAQVNYPYGASAEDAEQKLKYDLYYIRHYSLRLDAMICLKTLHIMLWGKGQ